MDANDFISLAGKLAASVNAGAHEVRTVLSQCAPAPEREQVLGLITHRKCAQASNEFTTSSTDQRAVRSDYGDVQPEHQT